MDGKSYRYAGLQRVFTPGLSVAEAVRFSLMRPNTSLVLTPSSRL